jgi:hypothetical protein
MRLRHNADMMPSWKASRNNEQVSKLLPKDELFESEVAGAIRGRRYVFDPEWIKNLKNAPLVDLENDSVREVHTFVDPSGGGQQSELVCVSFTHLPPPANQIVVVGLSKHPNQTEVDERECVTAHCIALRKLPYIHRHAMFVNYVERNYGGGPGAGRILSYTQPYGPCHSFCEKYSAPGVTTNHENKAEGVAMMINELSSGGIRFARTMAYNTPDAGEQKNIREALLTQFGRFQKKIRFKPNGTSTYYYSGKGGNGSPDDLAMSFCLLLWWAHEFVKRRNYLIQSKGQSFGP